jgi:bile acid-coenzyme A ligase
LLTAGRRPGEAADHERASKVALRGRPRAEPKEDAPVEEARLQGTWLDRLDELAREHPEAVALRVVGPAEEQLSWGDLAGRSAGVARLFAARGVGPGRVVCIEAPNGAAHVLAAHAAWRLGATILPLRWDLPAAERARLLELAGPALTVGGDAPGEDALTLAEVLAAPSADPADFPRPPAASPAWLIASGGSTGHPKLIAPGISTSLANGGLGYTGGPSTFADNTGHRHPTHLVCTPLYHTHGLTLLHKTLLEDFRVVLMRGFEAEAFLDLVEVERVAFFAIVPTMLIRLLRSPTIRRRDFSSVELMILGAGATPEWAIRECIDIIGPERLLMGYGMSEGMTAAFIRGDEWLARPGSVGRPIGAEVLVAGEDGRRLPAGEMGELYFRPLNGEHGFRYIGKAQARTLPGGYASAGDLGWVDQDGYLFIADRRTDMVVTGGANVFTAEVEAALLEHPDVEDAVVIGLADPEWGRRVHAIVQLRLGAGRAGAEAALRAHCKQRLAAYKAPRSFEIVDKIGRSEAGKVNRQALAREREEDTP